MDTSVDVRLGQATDTKLTILAATSVWLGGKWPDALLSNFFFKLVDSPIVSEIHWKPEINPS
jgi:hypothetical protein